MANLTPNPIGGTIFTALSLLPHSLLITCLECLRLPFILLTLLHRLHNRLAGPPIHESTVLKLIESRVRHWQISPNSSADSSYLPIISMSRLGCATLRLPGKIVTLQTSPQSG